MFILLSVAAAVITSTLQNAFLTQKRTFLTCLNNIYKNVLINSLIPLAVFRAMYGKSFLITDEYKARTFIKFFILSLAVGLLYIVINGVFSKYITFEIDKPKRPKTAAFVKILSVILVVLGCFCYFGTVWGLDSFGDITPDQLIINLTSPSDGTETGVYIDILEGPVFKLLLVTTGFCLFTFNKYKVIYNKNKKARTIFNGFAKRFISLILSVACLAGGILYAYEGFQVERMLKFYFGPSSTIIDDNYVDPRTVDMKFPEKKRNLIHIYLESLENSYLSKDLGGFIDVNLMPELTELSYEGITFSDTDNKFGGPMRITGTQWSVASMVNMTTGLPMKVPTSGNSYGAGGNFFPGAWTLNDILTEQGYEQTVMFGADAVFGGLDIYYGTHGDVKMMDYRYAKENGLIPKDYKVWWGYEDDKLYEFAKAEIIRLYETGKPFNFTMETADTHKPGGYLSEKAPRSYESSYANAIAYSTQQAVEFVKWIQEQPFYENTTIVVIGDHNSMDIDFFKAYNFTPEYLRTQYNLILNPASNVANYNESVTRNRLYSNFDMFPTILASMGVEFEGDRLGIGTNLFSGKDTIIEQYGLDEANSELEKSSELINKKIIFNPHEKEN